MGLVADHTLPFALFEMQSSAHRASQRGGGAGAGNVVVHLQLDGHCRVRGEGKEAQVGPGDLIFHRTGAANTLHFLQDYRQICLIVPETILAPEVANWSALTNTTLAAKSGHSRLLADHLRSLVSQVDALSPADMLDLAPFTLGLARAALGGLHELENKGSRLGSYQLDRIKRFVLEHLQHSSMNVDFIAQGVNLSARYIHQLFAEEGRSVMGFVMQKRLQRAYEQLRQPGCRLPISQIAYAWGFNDHAHFSRNFRKQFGLSPREMRAGR